MNDITTVGSLFQTKRSYHDRWSFLTSKIWKPKWLPPQVDISYYWFWKVSALFLQFESSIFWWNFIGLTFSFSLIKSDGVVSNRTAINWMSTWDGGLFIRISNNVDRYMTSYEMTTYLSSEKRLKKATNGGDIINWYRIELASY